MIKIDYVHHKWVQTGSGLMAPSELLNADIPFSIMAMEPALELATIDFLVCLASYHHNYGAYPKIEFQTELNGAGKEKSIAQLLPNRFDEKSHNWWSLFRPDSLSITSLIPALIWKQLYCGPGGLGYYPSKRSGMFVVFKEADTFKSFFSKNRFDVRKLDIMTLFPVTNQIEIESVTQGMCAYSGEADNVVEKFRIKNKARKMPEGVPPFCLDYSANRTERLYKQLYDESGSILDRYKGSGFCLVYDTVYNNAKLVSLRDLVFRTPDKISPDLRQLFFICFETLAKKYSDCFNIKLLKVFNMNNNQGPNRFSEMKHAFFEPILRDGLLLTDPEDINAVRQNAKKMVELAISSYKREIDLEGPNYRRNYDHLDELSRLLYWNFKQIFGADEGDSLEESEWVSESEQTEYTLTENERDAIDQRERAKIKKFKDIK